MRFFFSTHQYRLIIFLSALVLLIAGAFTGYALQGFILAIIIELSLLFGMVLLKSLLVPPWFGETKIKLLMLTIFGALASSMGGWNAFIFPLIIWFYQELGLTPPEELSFWHQLIILITVGFFFILMAIIFEKKNILQYPRDISNKNNKPFKTLDYEELRDRFCNYMVSVLNQIDDETNWSDADFTPLEAEVEMLSQRSTRTKILPDIIKAIHHDKSSRSFLIIGDPGSGKSVSLRRLARKLYDEVHKTGIVPVYINLREWNGPIEPTDEDISDFAYRYLLNKSGRSGKAFLENCYNLMLSQGLFFFLLDSFDEMPMVLDCDDRSDYLKNLSKEFDKFFNDIHECRGVLSSRPFRQPIGFRGRRINVRPFNEYQIRRAMKNWLRGWGRNSEIIIRKLLIDRPELAPALRNPFMSDLLSQYIIANPETLPNNYYELFNHYINKRLKEDISYIQDLNLTVDIILNTATLIAKVIYSTSGIGLEVEVLQLKKILKDDRLESIIKAMHNARIARWGGSVAETFSFVHRRFGEFFAVRSLSENEAFSFAHAIPSDSRWRDALVVYAGIAKDSIARKLANYSWAIIKKNRNFLFSGEIEKAIPAIHCLRFLRDSFQSRPKSTASFRDDLSELIIELLFKNDYLTRKIAAESLPLLTSSARSFGIKISFDYGASWISEAALRSCRHLARLEEDAISAISTYIKNLSVSELINSFRNMDFSLSLSDSLKSIRLYHRLDMLSIILLWSVFIIISLIILLYFKAFLFFYAIVTLIILACELALRINEYKKSKFYVKPIHRFHKVFSRCGFDSSLRIGILFATLPISIIMIYAKFFKNYFNFNPKTIELLRNSSISNELLIVSVCLIIISIPVEIFTFNWIKRLKKIVIKVSFFLILAFLTLLIITNYFNLINQFVSNNRLTIFPFMIIFAFITTFKYLLKTVIALKNYLKDYLIFKKLFLEREMTWTIIFQIANQFNTDYWQSRFFEMIRIRKIKICDSFIFSKQITFRGNKSAQEIARLKEEFFNLQE